MIQMTSETGRLNEDTAKGNLWLELTLKLDVGSLLGIPGEDMVSSLTIESVGLILESDADIVIPVGTGQLLCRTSSLTILSMETPHQGKNLVILVKGEAVAIQTMLGRSPKSRT